MNIHDIKIEDLKNSDDKYYLYCWWSGYVQNKKFVKFQKSIIIEFIFIMTIQKNAKMFV